MFPPPSPRVAAPQTPSSPLQCVNYIAEIDLVEEDLAIAEGAIIAAGRTTTTSSSSSTQRLLGVEWNFQDQNHIDNLITSLLIKLDEIDIPQRSVYLQSQRKQLVKRTEGLTDLWKEHHHRRSPSMSSSSSSKKKESTTRCVSSSTQTKIEKRMAAMEDKNSTVEPPLPPSPSSPSSPSRSSTPVTNNVPIVTPIIGKKHPPAVGGNGLIERTELKRMKLDLSNVGRLRTGTTSTFYAIYKNYYVHERDHVFEQIDLDDIIFNKCGGIWNNELKRYEFIRNPNADQCIHLLLCYRLYITIVVPTNFQLPKSNSNNSQQKQIPKLSEYKLQNYINKGIDITVEEKEDKRYSDYNPPSSNRSQGTPLAFSVGGNTFHHKEKLRDFDGKYNPTSKKWIFDYDNKHRSELEESYPDLKIQYIYAKKNEYKK